MSGGRSFRGPLMIDLEAWLNLETCSSSPGAGRRVQCGFCGQPLPHARLGDQDKNLASAKVMAARNSSGSSSQRLCHFVFQS